MTSEHPGGEVQARQTGGNQRRIRLPVLPAPGGSHSSASEPVPDSATLIEYAQREWANREERRGIHEKVSWETGWMSGYLTSAGNIQQARQQERERVLTRIDKEIATRENEMNRKAGLEENLTTVSGYCAAAGALNWVRNVLIKSELEVWQVLE